MTAYLKGGDLIKKIWIILFLSFIFPAEIFADELTVAVAANVQYAFEEIKTAFEKETGTVIKPVIGSSGKFVSQIENGAPFDVFLSADTEYPEALAKKGLTASDPVVYAYGKLVLWTFNDIDLSNGVEGLNAPNVQKIAIASPETAPYGRQAVNALKYYRVYDTINPKLVYGESIAQVNQFISSKAADIGFTAKSAVLAPNLKDQGKWIEVDKTAYEPIAQGVVILKYAEAKHLDAAQKFFDFLFSEQAQEIFKKYGYVLP